PNPAAVNEPLGGLWFAAGAPFLEVVGQAERLEPPSRKPRAEPERQAQGVAATQQVGELADVVAPASGHEEGRVVLALEDARRQVRQDAAGTGLDEQPRPGLVQMTDFRIEAHG